METSDHEKKTGGGKEAAGRRAVDFIEDGMTIGLGSGSTVYWMLKELSLRIKDGLRVQGIPSSTRTETWAQEWDIPLTGFHDTQTLDITIDGADEIDPGLQLLKGGGGSLVREKIVHHASKQVIIIADSGKLFSRLGTVPLPVEVVPFGWERTAARAGDLGCSPQLRHTNGGVFISDNGNYILDCTFPGIQEPAVLHDQLKAITGVVDTGLFPDTADFAIIGTDNITSIFRP
ncbi:ribose 5-phosphate isomerase A [Salibacterium sp. K-3]